MSLVFRISSTLDNKTESAAASAVSGLTRSRSRVNRLAAAVEGLELLEDRRLLSAALDMAAHKAPPRPAGTVYRFAPQPAAIDPRYAITADAAPTSHTKGVPALSSRPGAAYTIYLDVAGFNYVGAWNGEDTTDPDGNPTGNMVPGFTPSLDDVSPTGTFNANQVAAIKLIWARVAESYSELNVNVTTVDPAPASIAGDDTARRDFYDSTPNMMHTVIGSGARAAYVTDDNPEGNWVPGADGVSPGIGIVAGRADGPNANQGQHTNFMMSQDHASNGGNIPVTEAEYIGGISAHENAHSFGLNHQGDYSGNGTVHVNEYSFGDDATPHNYGTYIPIIGDANNRQRIAWRDGTDDEQDDNGVYERVNDLQRLLIKSSSAYATAQGRSDAADLHFIDDGIGNSIAAATPLPVSGSKVNPSLADGVIVPVSESNPTAIGAANYTTDYFSFSSNGSSTITLSVNDGSDHFTAGVVDDDGTLRSTLKIYNANGVVVATATEGVTTEIDTFSGKLAAGTYYAAVGSFGGHQQVNAADYDPAYYFDTGDFFLTGSGFGTAPVNAAPVVTTNPASKTVAAGASVTFTAAASGTPTPTVQWQVSTDGGSTYANVAGATFKTLTFTAAAAQTGNLYRAVFTNSVNSATTTAATLTVTPVLAGATITGTVFNDHNGSGTRDPGDGALLGVKVYADLDNSGVYKAGDPVAFTNSNGFYKLKNVAAGTYAVKTQPPAGFQQNFPFGMTARTVTVAGGDVVSGQDFGDTTSSHISGFVRLFMNGMLINMVGVSVTIKATNGTGTVYTRKTDANGYYGIGGQPNTAYTITLHVPAGYKLASGSVIRTTPTLKSGKNADGIDFKLLKSFV